MVLDIRLFRASPIRYTVHVHLKSKLFKNLDEMTSKAHLSAELRSNVCIYVAKEQRENKDSKGFKSAISKRLSAEIVVSTFDI